MSMEIKIASPRRWLFLTPQYLAVDAKLVISSLLHLIERGPPQFQAEVMGVVRFSPRGSETTDPPLNTSLLLANIRQSPHSFGRGTVAIDYQGHSSSTITRPNKSHTFAFGTRDFVHSLNQSIYRNGQGEAKQPAYMPSSGFLRESLRPVQPYLISNFPQPFSSTLSSLSNISSILTRIWPPGNNGAYFKMSEEPQLQQRKVQISNSMAAKQESLGFEIANPNHQALQIGLLRGTPHVACPSPFTALTPKFKNSFASTNSPLAKENSNLFDLTASPNETTIITNPANIIESQMTQVKNGANGNVVRLLPTSRKRRADEQLNVTPKRTQSAPPYAFSGSVLLFRQFEDGQVLPVITGVRCAVFRRRKLLYPKFYDADGKLLFEETRTGLYITRPGDNIVRCSKIESGIPVWEAETPNTSAA